MTETPGLKKKSQGQIQLLFKLQLKGNWNKTCWHLWYAAKGLHKRYIYSFKCIYFKVEKNMNQLSMLLSNKTRGGNPCKETLRK